MCGSCDHYAAEMIGRPETRPYYPIDHIRAWFIKYLSEAVEPMDKRRKKDFSEPLFHPDGYPLETQIDMDDILTKFDKALYAAENPHKFK